MSVRTLPKIAALVLILGVSSVLARWLARPPAQDVKPTAEPPPRRIFRQGIPVDIAGVTAHMQPSEVSRAWGPPIYTKDWGQGHTNSFYLNGQDIDFSEGERGAWIINGLRFTQGRYVLVDTGDSEADVEKALGSRHSLGDVLFGRDYYWEYRDKGEVMLVVYFSPAKRVKGVRLAS